MSDIRWYCNECNEERNHYQFADSSVRCLNCGIISEGEKNVSELKVWQLHEIPRSLEMTHTLIGNASIIKGYGNVYHHCPICDGWIEGTPDARESVGKNGRDYFCKRCDAKLAFVPALRVIDRFELLGMSLNPDGSITYESRIIESHLEDSE